MSVPVRLVQLYRGGKLESEHLGSLHVVRGEEVLLSAGDVDSYAFYRSSSKPLQALVLVTSGAVKRFGLDAEEIALATGSHSGVARHVEVAQRMLDKAEIDASLLDCGAHWPFDAEAALEARKTREKPDVLSNNCSGKHAAMLIAAKAMGAELEGYLEESHPVQQTIQGHIAAFAGVPFESLHVSCDGCSAPTFATPLTGIARSVARFGTGAGVEANLAAAAAIVRDAMLAHPLMVGGPKRFDTDMMEMTSAPLISKAGAEGMLIVSLPEEGVGVAVSALDGRDRGYRLLAVEILQHFGWITSAEAERIVEAQCPRVIRNHAGRAVGQMVSTVRTLLGEASR